MNVGFRIKQRRKALGLSADDVAKALGLDRSTLYRYESNDIEKLPTKILEPLASVLKTTPGYLMGWDESPVKFNSPTTTDDVVVFPVIGNIAAGYDNIVLEDWSGETVEVPNSYLKGRKRDDFVVLCVKGDSMFPEYRDNDKVLILKQSTMDYSGQVGAVIYDDDYATLKKVEYKYGEDWMNLVPINPTYPTTKVENEKLEHCKIVGIPKCLIREINQ